MLNLGLEDNDCVAVKLYSDIQHQPLSSITQPAVSIQSTSFRVFCRNPQSFNLGVSFDKKVDDCRTVTRKIEVAFKHLLTYLDYESLRL